MTMPPWSDDPELSRPYFRRLRELAAEHGLGQLSMGMSHDLEVAIEEGATHVRVGTALFGKRKASRVEGPRIVNGADPANGSGKVDHRRSTSCTASGSINPSKMTDTRRPTHTIQ